MINGTRGGGPVPCECSRPLPLARCLLRKPCCSTSAASSISPITIASVAAFARAEFTVDGRRARPRALRRRRAVHRRRRRRARLEGTLAAVSRRVHHRRAASAETTRCSATRCTSTSTASSRSAICGRASSRVRSTGCARWSRPACTSASSRTPTAPSPSGWPRRRVLQVGPGLGVEVACVIDSGAVGVSKPDPRIFHLALDAIGVAASRRVVRRRHAGHRRGRRTRRRAVADRDGSVRLPARRRLPPRLVARRGRGDGQRELSSIEQVGHELGPAQERRVARRPVDRRRRCAPRSSAATRREARGRRCTRRRSPASPATPRPRPCRPARRATAAATGRPRPPRPPACSRGRTRRPRARDRPSAHRRRARSPRRARCGPSPPVSAFSLADSPTSRANAVRYTRCATFGCTPASLITAPP